VRQYKDEFENIPTDHMSGNIDSIETDELFFKTNKFEKQNIEENHQMLPSTSFQQDN